MKNLKLPKEKSNESGLEVTSSSSEYPYGLLLRLDNETMKMLGISVSSYKIGDTVTVSAKGKVVEMSERESENDSYKSLEIQITHMDAPSKTSTISKVMKVMKDKNATGGMA